MNERGKGAVSFPEIHVNALCHECFAGSEKGDSGKKPAERAIEKLARDFRELDEMNVRREEWMAATALFTGFPFLKSTSTLFVTNVSRVLKKVSRKNVCTGGIRSTIDGVTVEALKPAFRKLGIFLK